MDEDRCPGLVWKRHIWIYTRNSDDSKCHGAIPAERGKGYLSGTETDLVRTVEERMLDRWMMLNDGDRYTGGKSQCRRVRRIEDEEKR